MAMFNSYVKLAEGKSFYSRLNENEIQNWSVSTEWFHVRSNFCHAYCDEKVMNIPNTESSSTNSFPKTWTFQTQTFYCTVFVLELLNSIHKKLAINRRFVFHNNVVNPTKTYKDQSQKLGGRRKKHTQKVGLWHWASHITPEKPTNTGPFRWAYRQGIQESRLARFRELKCIHMIQ